MTGTIAGFTSTGIDDNADATAITIDANESIMVNKTSENAATVGAQFRGDAVGLLQVTRNGGEPLQLNRLSSDGDIVRFYKDTSEVGSIFSGHGASQVGIGTNTTGITFNPATRSMMPADPSSTSPQLDATLDIGFPSVRWKDLYLSGGLKVGGTGAANTLDDYEEGNWTPASTSYGSLTVYSAKYTKIGRQVTLQVYVSGASANSNGVAFTGLPFQNLSAGWSTGALNYASSNTNHTNPHVRVVEGTSEVRLMKNPDTNMIGTEITGHMIFTVTYFAS